MGFDDLHDLAAKTKAHTDEAPKRVADGRDAVFAFSEQLARTAADEGWRDTLFCLVNDDEPPTRKSMEYAFVPPDGTDLLLNLWVTLPTGRHKVQMVLDSPDGTTLSCALHGGPSREAPVEQAPALASWFLEQAEGRIRGQITGQA